MTFNGWLQIALYCVLVILLTKPIGAYMTRVFNGERTLLSPGAAARSSAASTALCGVDETEEQHWMTYAVAMLAFSFAGFVVMYALQRLQDVLPFNPQDQAAVTPDLAFNTSVSFVTNTNWQSYVPETTMSYLTQMAGLTVHNFVSAATGIALAIALIRGFARRSAQDDRQFLGRSDPLRALHPAAGLDRRRPGVRLAGHAAEPATPIRSRHDSGRRQADHRPGAGGLAGGDQDAGHQWRRVLQRQLGASVREPERADQPDPDPADLLDRRGADQRVRPHGRQPAPGLGDLRGDGRAVPRRRDRRSTGPKRRQSGLRRAACRPGAERAAGRRQHGGQGGPLRHRQLGAVHHHHHRCLLRRRQQHA